MKHSSSALVVGAGLWGCTVARMLAEAGFHVVLHERRAVVGGNVRCEIDPQTGIEVHTYGSHIFHTDSEKVWSFISRFATFNAYQHKVLARAGDKMYFMPLGLALVNQFYGRNLSPRELPAFIAQEAAHAQIKDPCENLETQAISLIGRPLYETFIRGYTKKQWGTDPKFLSSAIIRRLPVRANWNINYFNDPHQGIPTEGYNSIFEKMLNHPLIELHTSSDFQLDPSERTPIFYSGRIDALFHEKLGALPWRSLRFEVEHLPIDDFQGTSVVNEVDETVPYTRTHEFKHYHPEQNYPSQTVIMREYSHTWQKGAEAYYPIDTPSSRALLARYQGLASHIPNLVVGGRLGAYRYLDMDDTIADAMQTVEKFLCVSCGCAHE